MSNYANMTKADLIKELEARDARIAAAIEAYKALKATIPVKVTRVSKLTEVMRFDTKDAMIEHYGASITKFVITRDGEKYVANKREWA